MKKGYFKEHMFTLLVALVVLAVAVVTGTWMWYGLFILFLIAAIQNYRTFDLDELKAEKWFNKLEPWEKKKVHKNNKE